jgi:hypothetical protein
MQRSRLEITSAPTSITTLIHLLLATLKPITKTLITLGCSFITRTLLLIITRCILITTP